MTIRICFIADSSSIHVQRIVSHHIKKNDDVLVLSSAVSHAAIPGARVVHLLTPQAPCASHVLGREAQRRGITNLVKMIVPDTVAWIAKYTKRALQLVRQHSACKEEIRLFNPGVIYCFRTFPEGVLAMFCRVRYLVLRTAGSDISKFTRYPLYRQIIRGVLKRANIVMTESLWEKRLIGSLCPSQVDINVNVIGIDTNLFRRAENRDKLRANYDLPADALVVLSSRYLDGDYNGWLVVEAMEGVVRECPRLVFLYVTPWPMDLHTKERVAAIAKQVPRMRFIEGPIPYPEMAKIVSCGDIYVSFSSVDGIPNSVLEAMSCGCVPILADLPQLHEWVEPGVTGYIVPQYNTACLAARVRYLYNNRDILDQVSARCVSKIRDLGSQEACMEQTREVLMRLVGSN